MRQHNSGFIPQETYWSIGTEERRGHDGDNAREAAKKYNDHRHPAGNIGVDGSLMYSFLEELVPLTNHAGIELASDSIGRIRLTGDLVKYKGLIWMYLEDGTAIPLGVGPGCFFQKDSNASSGQLVREAMTTQELVCNRVEVQSTFGIGFRTVPEQIGGLLLDMGMHSLARAKPLVRLEATGGLIHDNGESDPFFTLKSTQSFEYSGVAVGVILAAFLTEYKGKAGEVSFVWDRNGDDTPEIADDLFKEYPLPSAVVGEGEPPLILSSSVVGGVTTQRSGPIVLDLNRDYVIRVRAKLRTFDTDAEIIAMWDEFRSVTNLSELYPELPDSLGPIEEVLQNLGGDGNDLYEKIRYWQASHCSLELLNAKIRIDNFLGLSPDVNTLGVRISSTQIPEDARLSYI